MCLLSTWQELQKRRIAKLLRKLLPKLIYTQFIQNIQSTWRGKRGWFIAKTRKWAASEEQSAIHDKLNHSFVNNSYFCYFKTIMNKIDEIVIVQHLLNIRVTNPIKFFFFRSTPTKERKPKTAKRNFSL